jgi:glutamine amidotransferase
VPRVAVVDSGLSNLDSVVRALQEVGGTPYVASTGLELDRPDHIVLPGVGSFADGMAALRDRDLLDALCEEVTGVGVPLLGICLGMQLLATEGTEGGATRGLGFVPGRVVRLDPATSSERIPHVGWNEVEPRPHAVLFRDVPPGTDFYFVHSYHLLPDHESDVAATTPYCGGFTSAVQRDVVFGVQFHPEKSQAAGFAVLRAFLSL